MTRLPVISGRGCIKALEKAGFYIARQKSSHVIMRRADPYGKVVIPDHKTLKKGTLRAIIRQAGMTVDDFLALLD